MPNRLAAESSPYLRQHAQNPVEWYPWGEAAFAEARRRDVPIFLSIGYSTCHWCHVMERESFESRNVAAVLNETCVSIKVDREERPDVDRVYMAFVQASTGQGGWPMSVWLTPELKPFHGGTYFPPTGRWGRPGFVDLLREIGRAWREERPKVLAASNVVVERLIAFQPSDAEDGALDVPGLDALAHAADEFARSYDQRFGGFGGAPKFPRPSELLLLLRAWSVSHGTPDGRDTLRDMVVSTLGAMAKGGMRDHLGGGFHRYSVDERWRVPHFEKMLYDQAQLVLALIEASQAAADPLLAAVADDTLVYVDRDLSDAGGGFFSAEDADSVPANAVGQPGAHASEGAFYIWPQAEIETLLGETDARVVAQRFGVEPGGNAPFDPQQEFTGQNLLYTAATFEEIAGRVGRPVDDVVDVVARTRPVLLEARNRRPRPSLDDKVLTSWNGLMIAATARAGRVLGGADPERGAHWIGRAARAAAFVRTALWQPETQTLHRRWRAGDAGIEGYCEDYAAVVWGCLELLQATGDPAWLSWARAVQAAQDRLFWDEAGAGWFNTTGHDPSVLLRLKEEYDGAEPAAGSMAVRNLIELVHLEPDENASQRIARTLARLGPRLESGARAVPFMAMNLAAWHRGLTQIVVVGPAGRDDTRALHRVIAETYLPASLILPVDPSGGAGPGTLVAALPWLAPLTLRDGAATAYVCRAFTCEQPVTTPAALAILLRE
ncbi:MAG: thioredoxin domain-containing protein [Vicinamibacteraceae bacterium]